MGAHCIPRSVSTTGTARSSRPSSQGAGTRTGSRRNRPVSLTRVYSQPYRWGRWFDLHPHLGDLRHRRIVDLGCGIGDQARDLAAPGAEVPGIDSSQDVIEYAKRRRIPRARFRCDDVRDLGRLEPKPDGVWTSRARESGSSWPVHRAIVRPTDGSMRRAALGCRGTRPSGERIGADRECGRSEGRVAGRCHDPRRVARGCSRNGLQVGVAGGGSDVQAARRSAASSGSRGGRLGHRHAAPARETRSGGWKNHCSRLFFVAATDTDGPSRLRVTT